MKVGLGVPATVAEVPAAVVADGVETTVGDVGSMVKAPNPVVLACVASMSRCARRFTVSARMSNIRGKDEESSKY